MAAPESRGSIIGRRYDLSRQIYNSRDDNAPKSNKDEPKVVFMEPFDVAAGHLSRWF